MKWLALALLASVTFLPGKVSAQEKVPIGEIATVDDPAPTSWGIGGEDIVHITAKEGNATPIMRTETWDARTVEILSRTQAPPLTAGRASQDIQVVSRGGHEIIAVRRYFLMEVTAQDAKAVGMSKHALAEKWAASVRRAFPRIAPLPSRLGP